MKLAFVLFFLALNGSAYGQFVGREIRNASEDFGKSIPESILDGPRDGCNVPIEKAPFMASVYRGNSKKGSDDHMSAVIITDRYLLSAAFYFISGHVSGERVAYMGETDLTSLEGKNKYIISKIIFSDKPYDDIALIKLHKRIEFNEKQRPIALLSPNDLITEDEENAQVDVYGFGFTKRNPNDKTVVLKTKKMSIHMKELQIHGLILVNNNEEDNSCPGDAGTPFVMGDKLVAINLIHTKCGGRYYSDEFVITSVSAYYEWIVHQVGEENKREDQSYELDHDQSHELDHDQSHKLDHNLSHELDHDQIYNLDHDQSSVPNSAPQLYCACIASTVSFAVYGTLFEVIKCVNQFFIINHH